MMNMSVLTRTGVQEGLSVPKCPSARWPGISICTGLSVVTGCGIQAECAQGGKHTNKSLDLESDMVWKLCERPFVHRHDHGMEWGAGRRVVDQSGERRQVQT